ncbi:MAG: hypothetical protein AAGF11_32015 [Myxococcota bacterium]
MLAFEAVEIPGGYRVLVAWPTMPIVAGHDRLAKLRTTQKMRMFDAQILEKARHMGEVHAFVMRGRSEDGRAFWHIDDSLATAEANELSAFMFRAHLPLKRSMLELGCVDDLYIDWRRRETSAFESGLRRLRESLRSELAAAEPRSAVARGLRRDLWLSEQISFFSGATMTDLLDTVLPTRMARREQKLARVEALMAGEVGG